MAKSSTSDIMLEHTWRYFELHANQRMSLFNFFVVMSGALAAGIAASLQGSPNLSMIGVVLGVLLSLVSFVFWKLDQRVSFLIKHAELALVEIERNLPSDGARLFSTEPERAEGTKQKTNRWSRHWSYGQSFRIIFVIMIIFGICSALLSTLKFACGVRLDTLAPNTSIGQTCPGKPEVMSLLSNRRCQRCGEL